MNKKIQELGIYNIDKTTTMVGYATAVNKTMEQIAKKLKEQQSQIDAAHSIIDNYIRLVDSMQEQLDKLKNPTLLDK